MNTLKHRVLEFLPTKPFCSCDKTASKIRTQKYALLEPYLQLNPPHQCAWLLFDIDKPFSGLHVDRDKDFSWQYPWENAGLPVPNYVAITPGTGRYHMAYAISPVFTGENARKQPLEYLAAIERTYKNLLHGADHNFSGLITKNPLHEKWQVLHFHNGQYDLGELAAAVDGKLHPKREKAAPSGYGRNCDLFNELRYYAYAHVRDALSHNAWFDELLDRAEAINVTFAPPMSFPEVKGIVKSVAKWTWQRRETLYVKERKLQLDKNQPLSTRQAIGAIYVNETRTSSTEALLKASYRTLRTDGKKATQKAVAELSGKGIATVKRYWKSIKE